MNIEENHRIFPLKTPNQSIHATLAFFDIFNHPLKLEEFSQYLLGPIPEREKLEEQLKNDPQIQNDGDYFFLEGSGHIIKIRQEHELIAEKLWKKVRKFTPFLELVPFITMVACCNTLAFNNPGKESDIDLFIIVKHDRLMLARFFSTILFTLLGIRRHGNKIAAKFCLSFYLTDHDMNIEKLQKNEDIYLAYWVASLQPIIGQKTYDEFLESNQWTKVFFQRPLKPNTEHIQTPTFFKFFGKMWEWFLKGRFGNFLEEKLWKIQKKRHERHKQDLGPKSSVMINKNMLKFHNIDRRQEFAEKFRKRLLHLDASFEVYP